MWRAVLSFELRQQAREPLTALYLLVFLLLTFGYGASGAVELVSDRMGAPKESPWALALAFGGLTAFGQVITTMIAATAMLRDTAQRTLSLVATTALTPQRWFSARLTAALVVLMAVYAAMPVGAMLGAATAHTLTSARPYLSAYAIVTLPTCVVVAAILSSTAVLSRRLLGVLAAALALVGVWQLSLSLEANAATRVVGALLDPFGNAPVLALTREWTLAERTTRDVPLVGVLLWNRLLWLGASGIVVGVTLSRLRWQNLSQPAALMQSRAEHSDIGQARPLRERSHEAPTSSPVAAALALARFTAAWMWRDGGFRVVAVLAAVNALVNAWSRAPDGASALQFLMLIAGHARLFLILLATVYAGEVLWRERDVRIDALSDTVPVRTSVIAMGRLGGLFVAQLPVVLLLTVGAGLTIAFRAGSTSATVLAAWTLFVLWLPFAQLTALSVAVHAVVRNKVLAHLLLITGWVLAVVLDRHGASAWWYRFAEPASLLGDAGVAWRALTQRAVYWSAISAALLLIAAARWPRGVLAPLLPDSLPTSRRR